MSSPEDKLEFTPLTSGSLGEWLRSDKPISEYEPTRGFKLQPRSPEQRKSWWKALLKL